MRFIDRTGCRLGEKGLDREVKTMGQLTRTATKIAEQNDLGLVLTHYGSFRIIKASGLTAYEDVLWTLKEVDTFLKNLDAHKATKY
jgi:hypothetical protein